MKAKILLPVVIAIAIAGSAVAYQKTAKRMTLTASQPSALTVRLTGPDNLVSKSKGFTQGIPYAGCLYNIDWGDGATSPEVGTVAPYCSDDLTHVYGKAGKYTIKAMTYDQGPADGPTDVEKGTIEVDVK